MSKSVLEFPLLFVDEISGGKFIFPDENFSQEVRIRDELGEEFVYWIVVVGNEPRRVFTCDSCFWPRFL